MSENNIDQEHEISINSEETKQQDERMVPLGESIRYRKRAQLAEKELDDIKSEFKETSLQKDILDAELKEKNMENKIMLELNKSGVRDIETGLAIARMRMESNREADLGEIIEGLKKEKSYLFTKSQPSIARKTASAKAPLPEGEKALTEAASRASASGSRREIQEYLRIRRNYI